MKEVVVITGGGGFVGKHLQAELTHAWPDAEVVSWDLPAVDITDPSTYQKDLAELAPAWVVHLAAVASVPASLKDPEMTRRVNVEGTRSLLDAIQRTSQDTKMLFVSTADMYGMAATQYGAAPIPVLPLDEARPANPYGESKLEAERLIERRYSDTCIRVRPFPHIGPGQGRGFVTADFASQIAAIEAGAQKPVINVGNLEAKRDFTDVRDVVRAYRLLMESGSIGQVYHVATGIARSIQEVLDGLLAQTDQNIAVHIDKDRMRPSDIPVLVGDASQLAKTTGWQPEISFEQSLQDILQDWRTRN